MSLPDRSSVDPVRALCEAARRAARNNDYYYLSVLRAAPSHTGAQLLEELDKMGWELRRCDAA